jgi:hypothetical protein
MDEIAPEYDVVVLGTGGTTPPELPRRPKANTLQVSLNACFQGNSRAPVNGRDIDASAVFSVLRARRSCTSTAMITTAGMLPCRQVDRDKGLT